MYRCRMTKKRTYSGKRFTWERGNQLGQGGQGRTWSAIKVDDGSNGWVLKDLHGNAAKPRARMQREIEALDRLSCSGVPPLEDFSLGPDPFLVTPYAGKDLKKVTDETGPSSFERSLEMFEEIVAAVKCAHEAGVLHRDIKPANVIVGDGGVRLVDFGICADLDDGTQLTTTDEGFGTQAFTAPECSPGSYDDATRASDIYSLGKLFFWMISGGRLINREEFDDARVKLISDPNPWLRHAAAHLIGGTVRQAHTSRWSASELLRWVSWLRAKIAQHKAAEDDGQVIVFDGLGPNGEVRSGSKSVSFRGPSYYDHKIAIGFQVHDELGRVHLDEIALGLRRQAGTGRLHLAVTNDAADDSTSYDQRLPDLDQPIEVLEISTSARDPEIVYAASLTNPVLEPGRRYWICLSAPDPGTTVAWFSPQVAYPHEPAWVARHADEYPDGRAGRAKAPHHALQITGRPLGRKFPVI